VSNCLSVSQSLITDTSAYFYLLMKNCPPTQNPRNPKAEYGIDSYLILSDLYVVWEIYLYRTFGGRNDPDKVMLQRWPLKICITNYNLMRMVSVNFLKYIVQQKHFPIFQLFPIFPPSISFKFSIISNSPQSISGNSGYYLYMCVIYQKRRVDF